MDAGDIPKDYTNLVVKYKSLFAEKEGLNRQITQLQLLLRSSSRVSQNIHPPRGNTRSSFSQRARNWFRLVLHSKKATKKFSNVDNPMASSTLKKNSRNSKSLAETKANEAEIEKLLATKENWDFDVIRLEDISKMAPLVALGMKLFTKFGIGQVLSIDATTFRNWLTLIESNYHNSNPYHNSTHATDVLHATSYFLLTERLQELFRPLDNVTCLLAAAVHDVDHPGRTNPFLINTNDNLAILYNDLSILESHHASYTFQLTKSSQSVNIFKNLDTETYKTLRQGLIDMVLATDMAKHFEHLTKFNRIFQNTFFNVDSTFEGLTSDGHRASLASQDGGHQAIASVSDTDMNSEHGVLIKRILIKCADVSNPCRPLKLSVEWTKRIAEEYFQQTDEEKERGLPIVLPIFDRKSCCIPKSQTGFIDFFVRGMCQSWNAFLEIPELIENMKYNYAYWKYLEKLKVNDAVYLQKYVDEHPKPGRRSAAKQQPQKST